MLLLAICIGSPVDAAGPSPSAKPRSDSGSVGLHAQGRCVPSKRKSSISSSPWTYILLRCRFVFGHVITWFSVRRSKSDQQNEVLCPKLMKHS